MEFSCVSEIGKVRKENEDFHYAEVNNVSVFIIADGMGGYEGGEIASKIAVETLVEEVKKIEKMDENTMNHIFYKIENKIFDFSKSDEKYLGMGTTISGVFIENRNAIIAHVGDSRVYKVDRKKIIQITDDHTLVNELYKKGSINQKEVKTHPQKNVLLKAVGTGTFEKPDIHKIGFKDGDYLLLCSDGLTNKLEDKEILSIIRDKKNPEEITSALVDRAMEMDGSDNITAIVVRG